MVTKIRTTRMFFSWRPTFCLLIKSQTHNLALKWPWSWNDLDLVYNRDLFDILDVDDVPVAKWAFSYWVTLTLIKWPWYSTLDLDVKMYHHTKNLKNIYVNCFNSLNRHTARQTHKERDIQTQQKHYLPTDTEVKNI